MTEVVSVENKAQQAMAGFTSGAGMFTTAQATSFEDRKAVLSATINAKPLSEHLGETLMLVNIVAQVVTVNDAATGDDIDALRTVLICADGESYGAVSVALASSLRDIFAVLGQPDQWPNGGLGIIVTEEKGSRAGRNYFKVSLA